MGSYSTHSNISLFGPTLSVVPFKHGFDYLNYKLINITL